MSMKAKIYVNPAFINLSEHIEQIPSNFWTTGDVLHNGRNEIRKVVVQGETLVIKYFKKITWANRLIYSTIRKSKAQRSFENSRRLICNGISTPTPIAYINTYRCGLLYQSFYISDFTNSRPVLEFINSPITKAESALKSLAQFSYKLHRLGIFHGDYNTSNVLYLYDGSEYRFTLIDNNRIKFYHYTKRRGLKNLIRMKFPIEKIGIISSEYAQISESNDLRTLFLLILFRLQFQHMRELKEMIKSFIKGNQSIEKAKC